MLSTAAALRALVAIELGRPDDAERWADRALELASAEDVFTQLPAGRARALLLSARGRHDEAERVARDVVRLAETTDMLREQGESFETLGHVLRQPAEPARRQRPSSAPRRRSRARATW